MHTTILIANIAIILLTLAILWNTHTIRTKLYGLGIIIAVFVVLYASDNIEHFDPIPTPNLLQASINNFMANKDTMQQIAEAGDQTPATLLTLISELNANIDDLSKQLIANNMQSGLMPETVTFETSDNVLNNVQVYKQLQLAKLAELRNQLTKTQQLIDARAATDTSNNYRPIKVFNSCVISEADGTYSSELS
jgi:hypothetical protein